MGRFDNLDKIFEIADNSLDTVVVKVKDLTPLDVALHPFVSANESYITVTKGETNTLTTILRDGRTGVSFHWGYGGYTLISTELEDLKKAVIKFVQENGILLGLNFSKITKATVGYNHNYGKWQLRIEGRNDSSRGLLNANYFSETAKDVSDMVEESKKYIKADSWEHTFSERTGWEHYKAINPRPAH